MCREVEGASGNTARCGGSRLEHCEVKWCRLRLRWLQEAEEAVSTSRRMSRENDVMRHITTIVQFRPDVRRISDSREYGALLPQSFDLKHPRGNDTNHHSNQVVRTLNGSVKKLSTNYFNALKKMGLFTQAWQVARREWPPLNCITWHVKKTGWNQHKTETSVYTRPRNKFLYVVAV